MRFVKNIFFYFQLISSDEQLLKIFIIAFFAVVVLSIELFRLATEIKKDEENGSSLSKIEQL